ncbi:MAG: choice-of-anchor J domain-containing protein, partial [Bacteroidales bacterium]|nr:choice-of-anchor J domain-containing protein [Bacteroidales bacterium]
MNKHIAMKAKSIKILALAAMLTFGLGIHAQTATVHTLPYACGFDTTDLAMLGWTTIDYNNDGYTWTTNGPLNGAPHSSSGYVASASYIYGTGDIAPDNFLVSPRIAMTDSAMLTWWHRVANSMYPADHYSVYISTAGNTAADFLATTPVYEYTPTSENYPIWSQVALDLSAYAGDTIYIAFRHHNCFGQYALLLDDVKVETFVSPWSVADTVPW